MLQIGIDLRFLDFQRRVTIFPGIQQRPRFIPFEFRFAQTMAQFFQPRRHFDDGHAQPVAFENQLVAGFAKTLDRKSSLRLLLLGFGNLLDGAASALFEVRSLLAERVQFTNGRGSAFFQNGKPRLNFGRIRGAALRCQGAGTSVRGVVLRDFRIERILRRGDPGQLDFGLPQRRFQFDAFGGKPFDFGAGDSPAAFGMDKVRRQRPNAMIHRQDGLFDFLKFRGQPGLQAHPMSSEQIQQPRHFLFRIRGLARSRIGLAIQLANFAFQRQRAQRFLLSPADNVPVDDFTAARHKPVVRITAGRVPMHPRASPRYRHRAAGWQNAARGR